MHASLDKLSAKANYSCNAKYAYNAVKIVITIWERLSPEPQEKTLSEIRLSRLGRRGSHGKANANKKENAAIIERRISLNLLSCDSGDSCSQIGITIFTAVWRGHVCRCGLIRTGITIARHVGATSV